MSLKKNTSAVLYALILDSDGVAVTTGATNVYLTIENGTQTASTNTATHKGNGQWALSVTAAEMNGDQIGVLWSNSNGFNVGQVIVTQAKLVSELKDETMRGTDGANTVLPDNAGIANLVSNQGNWLTATGFSTVNFSDTTIINAINALNDFNPATQQVTAGNMVDVSGLMLASSYVPPDNTSITAILNDTNELQQNQGNWATATGFSTFNPATDEVKANVVKLRNYTISGDGNTTPFFV